MTKRSVTLLTAVIASIIICAVPQTAAASQFWSQEIESALAARTEFLEQIGLTDKDLLSARTWVGSQRQSFEERISAQAGHKAPGFTTSAALLTKGTAERFSVMRL